MGIPQEFKWNKRWAILTVILVLVLSYGLLMLRFSLRNDQIEYFLPVRVYMSDAFNHHEFLLWNPFVAGGYPMHSDMQAPVWNPVVILFSWLFDYNASLLSAELLLYYIIGSIGCFYFARNFSRNYYSCIVIAIIYGCGGFASSILEFMSWVGSFAYLPWAVHFFYLLLKKRDLYTSIRFSLALWLLLVSGYPSFLIYLGYVLLAAVLAYCYLLYARKRQGEITGILVYGSFSLLLLAVFSLPAIHSFYEYLPYYGRGAGASVGQLNVENFDWNYFVSLLFPMAGMVAYGNEMYIGLIPCLALFCFIRRKPVFTFRDGFLALGLVYTFLFTMGRSTPLRMWSARHLPLLGAFGFSHSVGIFLLLGLFVWLAPKLDIVFSDGLRERERLLRRAAWVAGLALAGYLLAGPDRGLFRDGLVRAVYYLSAGWQLVLLAVAGFYPGIYRSAKRVFLFILADLVISILVVAPLTGFSLVPPGVFNRSAEQFYREEAREDLLFPQVKQERINSHNKRREVNVMRLTARNNFPSNTRLEAFYNYVMDSARYTRLLSLPFIFAADSTVLEVQNIELGYNYIDIDVKSGADCQMVLQQTYYKRWRPEKPENALTAYSGVFLQVQLKKGENRVRLDYYKKDLFYEAVLSVVGLSVAGILLLIGYRRRLWKEG